MLRSRFLWKLFAGYAFLILLSSALIGGLVARRVETETLAETDLRLHAVAALLRDTVAAAQKNGGVEHLQGRIQVLGAEAATRLTVITPEGRVVADSEHDPRRMDDHSDRPEILQAWAEGVGASSRYSTTLKQQMRYHALPLYVDGRPVAMARTSLPLDVLENRLADLRRAVGLGAVAGILFALGLGFLYARTITRPLLSMAEAAEEIADGAYDQRIEASGRDELGKLAKAFNTMSRQLRGSMSAMASDRKRLTAILSSMTEGVVAVDRDERIVHMNGVAGRLLEADPNAVLSHPIWEVTRILEVSEALGETLEEGRLVQQTVRQPGSPDRVLQLYASPLLTDAGVAGAVLVVKDVTQLRHLETMRRDFIGNASHELKTPITVIRGLVETLLDDPDADPGVRQRFLQRVLAQSDRMKNLVSDLLSLSRLESGASVLEIQPLDLREPIEEAVRSLLTLAEGRGVRIDCDLPDRPLLVEGDEEGLRQAVSNLLDNAVKYSQAEAVTVRLRWEPGEAVVEVEDQGIGIEADHRDRIFERFYRVDKARSSAVGGTGLGLAIVKHIALAHGGTVSLRSTPGEGSTFALRLPLLRR
ncbi:MAG: ATP-binding protein, partial [Acidobacteriota bacterium]